MNYRCFFILFYYLVSILLFCDDVWAITSVKDFIDKKSPTIIKANQVDGNQKEQILNAKGNVEITKGLTTLNADEIIYDKKNKNIKLYGNIIVKNLEVGEIKSSQVEIRDDFSSGLFKDVDMIFSDGSYIKANKVKKNSSYSTTFFNPFYSFCPNINIAKSNSIIDKEKNFAVIKSKETEIDKKNGFIKSKHGILKILEVPILYTPYLRTPLSSKKRESGFLFPNYNKDNKFRLGVKLPFYVNISPDKDLTITPKLSLDGNKYLITSVYRHLTDYGEYNLGFEIANNKLDNTINDNTIIKRSSKNNRWLITGDGNFDLDYNNGFSFKINTMSDSSYLRDYQNNYLSHATSEIKFDYIKDRDYFSIKTIRFQELENYNQKNQQQFVLPQIDHEISFAPLLFNEQISLKTNFVSINRESGLQYNRMSVTPQVSVPFNFYGNLINVNLLLQNDLYLLDQNYKYNEPHNKYKNEQINHRPKLAIDWSLPLIKKTKESTILIEPMINFVSTKSVLKYKDLANEDSNNSELTFSNIFSNDYLIGYDRNENGERFGYGFKSSLFNKYGEFSLGLGQSYRINNQDQDVLIKGYNYRNLSNIVGKAIYKDKSSFFASYSFQLNQVNYVNDVNEVSIGFDYKKIKLVGNYILMRRNFQNENKREQINLLSSLKISNKWIGNFSATKNFISGKVISKKIELIRNGCCTDFSIYAIENNPENFNKAERSYGVNFSFKNL